MAIENLRLKGTGLTSTLRCSLKCKLCCTFSPYYNPPKHFSAKRLCDTIDRYFAVVDSVGKFTISGGEPLLHQELAEVVEYASKYFDRVDTFEIITNGTMIPSEKLLSVLSEHPGKVSIMVDNYGEISPKVDEVAALFKKHNIDYRERNYTPENPHCGGWVDFGNFTQIHFTPEEIKQKFDSCAYPRKLQFCFSIMDGEVHPCTPSRRAMELGVIPKNRDEYIDLFDDTQSKEELREQFYAIQNIESLSACAFCNGLCDDSERFTPAAQL